MDKQGNPPGIIRDEEVDPIPPLLKMMIKRMVEWDVLPHTCIPNSCIVNIYDKDDCIPPHIDHHDFLRPFSTVSFLSECRILFGTELKVLGPGDFSGSSAISLPTGSVLILNGNGADVAKHCVPAVPTKRKMDEKKLPFKFTPDPDLSNLRPLSYPPKGLMPQPIQSHGSPVPVPLRTPLVQKQLTEANSNRKEEQSNSIRRRRPYRLIEDDFSPLGSASARLCKRAVNELRY
ncbi:hypothetical protein Cni_G26644 [Canna indica]|uniref:Fe2OG dioxygenase domain-containing protein n=1 Tax=Canna indica TaxID=4628 RepID=A0AAQ3QQP9_9LILI|nr:hypothetical protein Cni_G26644 [Canna indica]